MIQTPASILLEIIYALADHVPPGPELILLTMVASRIALSPLSISGSAVAEARERISALKALKPEVA